MKRLPLFQAFIDIHLGPPDNPSRTVLSILTPYTIRPSRAAGTGAIRKAFDKAEVQSNGKDRAGARTWLGGWEPASDFERFEVYWPRAEEGAGESPIDARCFCGLRWSVDACCGTLCLRQSQVRKAHLEERKATA